MWGAPVTWKHGGCVIFFYSSHSRRVSLSPLVPPHNVGLPAEDSMSALEGEVIMAADVST